MAGPTIAVRVLGDLKGLGASLSEAGSQASGVASRGTAAFRSFLGSVNATGALGPLGGMLDQIAGSLDALTGSGKRLGAVMMGAGGALTGVGAGLSAFGSKEQAAQQQLSAALEAAGASYDDYGDQIEAAIRHGESFGHTSHETQNALQKLTQATHDPDKALQLLNGTFDLAAAKHEDLGTAAGQLGKVYNGNKKLLKEFGIKIDENTGLTKDGQTATEALAKVLAGQASAAQDTFMGKLDAVKARITDAVSQFGQKYGPALQGIGIAVMSLGAIWETVGPVMAAMSSLGLGPLLLIAAAVAALIAVVYVLYTNWDTIWAAMQAAVSAVWDWISTNWPLLLAVLLGPIGIAVDLIVKYWDQIKAGAGAVVDFITTVWNTLVAFFAAIPGRVAGFFRAIWDGVRSGVSSAHDWIADRWNDTVAFFAGIPGRLASAFSGMWDGILNAFRSVINGVIDLWNRLHFTLPHVDLGPLGEIGGGTIGVPQIPHLAQGGLITRDGLVYAHAGEAISPYGNMGPAVSIENAHFAEAVDVDVFMSRVAWTMQTRTA